MNGPEPTGFCAIERSPLRWIALGETIAAEPCAKMLSSCENGVVVRAITVWSSGVSTAVIGSQIGRLVGVRWRSIVRSMLNLTAAASIGVPSWNLAPRRKVKVIDLRSLAIVQ